MRSSAADHPDSSLAVSSVKLLSEAGRSTFSSTSSFGGDRGAWGMLSRPSKSSALRPRGMSSGTRRWRLGVEKGLISGGSVVVFVLREVGLQCGKS